MRRHSRQTSPDGARADARTLARRAVETSQAIAQAEGALAAEARAAAAGPAATELRQTLSAIAGRLPEASMLRRQISRTLDDLDRIGRAAERAGMRAELRAQRAQVRSV